MRPKIALIGGGNIGGVLAEQIALRELDFARGWDGYELRFTTRPPMATWLMMDVRLRMRPYPQPFI